MKDFDLFKKIWELIQAIFAKIKELLGGAADTTEEE